jgi:hypothetical protein
MIKEKFSVKMRSCVKEFERRKHERKFYWLNGATVPAKQEKNLGTWNNKLDKIKKRMFIMEHRTITIVTSKLSVLEVLTGKDKSKV